MNINTIYKGEAQSVLKQFDDGCIDLTITSPPYDKLRKYEDCDWSYEVFKKVANELYRVTKDGGVVVWIVGDSTINGSETGSSSLYFKKTGFRLHDTMIFEKNTSAYPSGPNSVRYTNTFEYMFVLSKGKPKTINLIQDKPNKYAGQQQWGGIPLRKDDKLVKTDNKSVIKEFGVRNNIWRFEVQGGKMTDDKIAHKHPAIYPEKLVKDHIQSWSKENDIVLDPFAGSGTTLKVAHLMKRNFVGIERNENYINDIIVPRLKRYIFDFNVCLKDIRLKKRE